MMVGTAIEGKGGIASVVKGYIDAGIMEQFNIDYFVTHREGTRIEKLLLYFKILFKILLNLKNYSIVHVHTACWWSFRRLSVVIIISKLARKKVIIHIHGAEFDKYYSNSCVIEKYLIRFSFFICDKVVVLSEEWKTRIISFCNGSKIVVIPNCIDFEIKEHADIYREKTQHPLNILFMGELGERKGVYDLLSAIKLLNSKISQTKILICGNGEVENVKKQVIELGIDDHVSVLGWVSGDYKKKLIDGSYIFVLPSYHEGLPVSILEAMSSGTPIVSTSVGGIPTAVQNEVEGYLIEPGDVKSLADRIEKLLSDKEKWEKMSKAARNKIQDQFSINNLRFFLEKLYFFS